MAMSEGPETAGALHSVPLGVAPPTRMPKSVTIREEANEIAFFSQWGKPSLADGGDSVVIERQHYSHALRALDAAEADLQASEHDYDQAFERHSAAQDTGPMAREYLRVVLKPYIKSIWDMQNAVDVAGDAADAAWERLQHPAGVIPASRNVDEVAEFHLPGDTGQSLAFDASQALGHDPDLLERWHAASSEYEQAQHACKKADQQLAQASDVFDHFDRGRDKWLEQESLQAGAMVSAATEQADRAGQHYASTKVMYMRILGKIDKVNGPGQKLAAQWQAARLQLEASFNARDAARKGVTQAVDFLNSRPQYVERFMQERLEDMSAAEDAVIAAQEWLSETMVAMDALMQRACSDHTLAPARLATIAEEPDDWNPVAWPARGVAVAGPAEAHGDEWLSSPGPHERDVALTGISSLDTTAASQAF